MSFRAMCKCMIQFVTNLLRVGVENHSLTCSRVWEEYPTLTISGYKTFTVDIATVLAETLSCIDARRVPALILYWAWRTVISSQPISSLVWDFASSCISMRRCLIFQSLVANCRMVTITSPKREVPSKITEVFCPGISCLIWPTSSQWMKG